MKNIFIKSFSLLFFFVLFSIPVISFATEGTCSWHGGVNCSAGADWDGSAICNDGWRDSSEIYADQVMCQQQKYGCMNAQQIYEKYGLPEKLSEMQDFLQKMNSAYQSCITNADMETNINKHAVMVLQCTSNNSELSSQYNTLSAEYDRLKSQADLECEQTGRQELEKLKAELGYYGTPATPPASPAPSTYIPTQPIKFDTGPSMTNDDRCIKLNLGTWYNTDKQTCDTCPTGMVKDPNANKCRIPSMAPAAVVPVTSVKKNRIETSPKPETILPPKTLSIVSSSTESTTSILEASTTVEITPPVIVESPIQPSQLPTLPPESKTFWSKVLSWFKFW